MSTTKVSKALPPAVLKSTDLLQVTMEFAGEPLVGRVSRSWNLAVLNSYSAILGSYQKHAIIRNYIPDPSELPKCSKKEVVRMQVAITCIRIKKAALSYYNLGEIKLTSPLDLRPIAEAICIKKRDRGLDKLDAIYRHLQKIAARTN